jgi:hypothetical protein
LHQIKRMLITQKCCRLLAIFLCLLFTTISYAQDWGKPVPVGQADPRFNVAVRRSWGFGTEEYRYYVHNNTNTEYRMVITVTITVACEGTKSYKLGYNRVVHLKPGGDFGPKDDYAHLYTSGADNFKDCRLPDGKSFTLFKAISYEISNIEDVTAKKAAEEKKRQDEIAAAAEKKKQEEAARVAAAEKKKQEDAAKAAAAEKKKQEDAAKAAAEKKKQEDAAKAKAAATAKEQTAASGKTTAATGKAGTTTTGKGTSAKPATGKNNVTASGATTDADAKAAAEQKKQEEAEKQAAAREAQRQKEAAEKAAEEKRLQQRQADYDQWKNKKREEQSKQDAAAAGATTAAVLFLIPIIYDGMGNVNPDFVFNPATNKPQMYAGFDIGLGLSTMPMLFNSVKSTMVNGRDVVTKGISAADAFNVNLCAAGKIGLESNYYGGYGFLAPQIGLEPTFHGHNLSLLNYGIRAYGGLKWVKIYGEYAGGIGRGYSKSSSDVEESGSASSDLSYSKLGVGLRFTLGPNTDYVRSHISIGLISEKLDLTGTNGFIDPQTGYLNTSSINTPAIKGFAFQWKQDHTFNLFANVYPSYTYAGKVESGSGPLSTSFSSRKTGLFMEIGFLRSIDFF